MNKRILTYRDEVRFFQKIKSTGIGCWFWEGLMDKRGYGIFTYDYKNHFAHRFSYEIHKSIIPEGLLCLP